MKNQKQGEQNKNWENKKHFKKQKNNVACIPDSGLLVVLSVPRSACLAYFQPAGASRSLQGLNPQKAGKTPLKHPQKPICVYRGRGVLLVLRLVLVVVVVVLLLLVCLVVLVLV
jgi:hypothetical protein